VEITYYLILFDGECNFCNFWVRFILKRDKKGVFKFATLNSEIGGNIKQQFQLSERIDSIVLLKNNQVYIKSAAALEIARNLSGLWFLLGVFKIIPTFISDAVYDFVAKNRYRWFGKSVCELPQNLEDKNKFL
jgi:predicted DCC family thiol-disulfide oxidoreductase YuxK